MKSPASVLSGTSARANASAKYSPFFSTCSSLVPSANVDGHLHRRLCRAPRRRRSATPTRRRRPGNAGWPRSPLAGISTRCGNRRRVARARAALERDQVGAVGRARRIHDEERHARDGDVAEPVQRDRLVALVLAAEPAPAVGRVGLPQIDDAELLLVRRADEASGCRAGIRLRAPRSPSGISDRRVFSRSRCLPS